MKDFTFYSDQEIVEGVKRLDNQAFKAILHDRLKSIRKYVKNNSGSEEKAKEIEQRVVIVLFENVRDNKYTYSSSVKLSTYLFRIGKNLWLKELKKRKDVSLESISFLESHEEAISVDDDKSGQINRLNELLENLKEPCKTLLLGKYYYKISDEELSNEIGNITLANVRKRRYKCIQQLRKLFSNQKLTDG